MLKKVGYSAFWFKIAQKFPKKVLVFQKVARSCSLTKKVAQNPKSCLKVAEQNLERSSGGIQEQYKMSARNNPGETQK